jgi:hypothetical protein
MKMKHKIQIRYAIWHRSFWQVEAPDEATAERMALEALADSDFEENADCHRLEPDSDARMGIEDEEVVKTEAA